MQIVIAGAGSVGRSIARELISHGHEVTLVDRSAEAMRIASVPEADWQLADACDIDALERAGAETCDVIVAATGDDKANLVISLLAKTEYGVPRTVARINNPKSEWLFDETWGVDVAVSTPRFMTALVEEAVSVGSLVSIFHFHQSGASMHELTLPEDSPVIGELVTDIELPPHTVLAAILRDYRPITPDRDERFERGDELIFLTAREGESSLEELPSSSRDGGRRRYRSARAWAWAIRLGATSSQMNHRVTAYSGTPRMRRPPRGRTRPERRPGRGVPRRRAAGRT